jgi:two-component system, NarL family, sensor histidine kinase UhpB
MWASPCFPPRAAALQIPRMGVAVALLLAALAAPAAHAANLPALKVQQAVAVAEVGEGSDNFPVAAASTEVRLPDEWALSRPGHSGVVWYRVAFDAPAGAAPNRLAALYIERACGNVDIDLNGHRIHSAAPRGDRALHGCAEPLLVTLPQAWLLPKGNSLDVRLRGRALHGVASRQRAGGLSALQIGPRDALTAQHARRVFWSVRVPQALSIMLGMLGLAVLLLDSWNRRSSHLRPYGWWPPRACCSCCAWPAGAGVRSKNGCGRNAC